MVWMVTQSGGLGRLPGRGTSWMEICRKVRVGHMLLKKRWRGVLGLSWERYQQALMGGGAALFLDYLCLDKLGRLLAAVLENMYSGNLRCFSKGYQGELTIGLRLVAMLALDGHCQEVGWLCEEVS
jgi:hypothetical protein